MNTENLRLKNCLMIELMKRICYNLTGDISEREYIDR